ncbi:MAG: Ig-like domain-containing protein [Isosphaerales bacterium]
MGQATRLGKGRRSRRFLRSLGEQLEQRILLAGDAKNVFANLNGSIAYPNGTQSIAITLSTANFTLPQGNVVLGFQLEASGSALDPTAIQIKDSKGKTVEPIYTNPDLAQKTQSLTVAQLGLGTYTIIFGAERRTSGAYHLAVFLAGDATGNHVVDEYDVKQIEQSYGSHSGDGRYTVEADSNLDGVINAFDLSQALSNRGDSTNLSPLSVSLALSPAPVQLPDGTLVTNQSSLTVSGITEPGATVAVETGADGRFDDGSTTANSSGQYALTVSLSRGGNYIQVRSTDLFGQQTISSVPVSLDTEAPIVSIAPPPVATVHSPTTWVTNTNPTITGQVTDNLSGVASLSEQIDSGPVVPVAFDASGSFQLTTSLALDGSADGLHTVQFVAADQVGNVSHAFDFSFKLDTQPPTQPVFGLDPASANVGPETTTDAIVTLVGLTDPGVTLSLLGTGMTTGSFSTGDFQFTGVGVEIGPNALTVQATDAAGNQSSYTRTITRVASASGPIISAALSDDTAPGGTTNSDGITSDPSISGTITDASPITELDAGFDGTPSTAFVGILTDLQANGSFALGRAEIVRINGASALADGAHTLHLVAGDQAGDVSSTYDIAFTLDDQPPSLAVTSPANGILTNANVVVTGMAGDNLSGVESLTGQVDGGAATTVSFDTATGAFSFATNLNLTGGKSDGKHVVVIQAVDVAGNVTSDTIHFTLKTIPPAQPIFALAAADRESGSALATTDGEVTLVGQTDPNITVTLVGTTATAQTTNTGTFQFPNMPLSLGDSALAVVATDGAGNTSQYQVTIHRDSATGGVNQVIYWNQVQLQAIENDASTAEYASRGLAMVSAAVYDSVNAIDGTPGYYISLKAPADASADAAVAAAAYTVLSYLYPAQVSNFDSLLATDMAGIPDGQSKTDGMSVGQSVASAIIAMRANDGSTNYVAYTPGTAPDDWQPTAPAYMPAENPQWATLKPFAMTSDSQFRPGPPPALTSQEYADDVNYTLNIGSVNSTTRTADETQIAKFWNDGAGTYTPPGHWNAIAELVAQQQGDSLAQDARLFAELNIAEGDAAIVAWDAKYTDNSWRPIQLAGGAGTAVNSQIETIANWEPLINTPPFPEYISGHSAFSAAAAAILTAVFGDNYSFTASSFGLPGVTRSYTSFEQAAEEAGMSRIYGGIHFLFSDTAALTAGSELGAYVLQTFSTTSDQTPPAITLTNPASGSVTTSSNITITGTVLDNLSGVQSLQAQIDGGAFTPVSFDAQGNFSQTTAFATDGTADGAHTVNFQATDVAGNVTPLVSVAMTLDTQAPTLTLSSPLAGTLTDGELLSGTAVTGSPVTALSYNFDGGTEFPVAFGTDGSFSTPLDLSALGVGTHTLTLTVQDAAGNVAHDTVDLNLESPPALTRSSIAPTAGSTDVGVTFRPKIVFSRPIDPTTLTASDFHLTDTSGNVIPTTIVPSDDGTYAWLFPTNPMPGASIVTLTVDGSQIKTPDGTLLDAAGTGTPGSILTETFTTVSTANVPGTSLSGIVADPGPDDKPDTFDDVRPGPDGILMTGDDIYLLPIAGVTVSILGDPQDSVTTGADGSFSFSSVPSGDVKLVIDGTTATNPPVGFYFPLMTMDLTIKPGQANTVMGSMTTPQGEGVNPTDLGVYLPRVASSILQTVSTTQPTTLTIQGTAGQGLTPQQQQELTLTVQPNSLIGPNGQKLASGQAGISMVPPQLVMDMLPAGVMQHDFDITIQAPGVTTFSTPATLTFPNVFDAAPGTQLDVLSFDHTTGRLVIDGTATVSADGLTVTTDPGAGVTAPGWHALTPPGALAKSENAMIPSSSITVSADGQSETADLIVNGRAGDVVTINLSSVGGVNNAFEDLELTGDNNPNWGTVLDGSGNVIKGGYSLNGLVFYFVPNLDNSIYAFAKQEGVSVETQLTLEGTVLNVGQLPGGPASRTVTLYTYIYIADGYSGTGSDAVTVGTDTISVYRDQQRLSYLGFLGMDGKPLTVDGQLGPNTEWAIAVFNAAVTGTVQIMPNAFASINQGWINAQNAPHWTNIATDLASEGFDFSDANGHTWGTSWLEQSVSAVLQPSIFHQINSISQEQGGAFGTHHTHQTGMDVDVQVPNLQNGYFFVTNSNGFAVATGNDPDGNPVQNGILIVNVSDNNYTIGEFAAFPDNGSGNPAVPNGWQAITGAQLVSPAPGSKGAQPLYLTLAAYQKWLSKLLVLAPNYKTTQDQLITLFSNLFNLNATYYPGPTVKYIYYNDPLLWAMFPGKVFYFAGHNGHFHVDIAPPKSIVGYGSAPSESSESSSALTPVSAESVSTVAGFGSDPSLYYRFALPNGTAAVYGKSNADGSLSVFLGANLIYEATFYQPSTNQWADYLVQTNASGQPTDLANILLANFGGTDSNGDGIPDMGKIAMGLDTNGPDQTTDGLSYAANLEAGLGPLGRAGTLPGIVASLPLQGEAEGIALEGSSLDPTGQTAYVATGSHGLAIVDASQFVKPIVLSQIQLGGNSTDVSVDPELQIAVVASNTGGLNLVDVSNPMQPKLLQTINVDAEAVRVVDGVAYAAVGTGVKAYDLVTDSLLQTLDLGGRSIDGMALDGSFLYTIDSGNTLQVIDISGPEMVARGSVTLAPGATLAAGSGALFVADGIAYVGVTRDLNPPFGVLSGYITADVSNPDSPAALSILPTAAAGGNAVSINGSGIALTVGSDLNGPALDVFDSSDPTTSGQFLTRFALPTPALDVVIAEGIGFVADGSAGLQVINYLPFDNKGQAPTNVTVSAPGADVDPSTPGIQVDSGSLIHFEATATDDVQVRNVELLINGQVVDNAVTFPWNLSAVVPTFTPDNTSFVVQALATDTGGNATLSDPTSLILLPDTTPPTIVSLNPVNGSTRPEGTAQFGIRFSKPMAADSIQASAFEMVDSSGVAHPASGVLLFNSDEQVRLTFTDLVADNYQLVIHAATLTDRSGNPLGGSDVVVSHLTLTYRSTITSTVADADPKNAGTQVLVGSTIPLKVTTNPGIQVQEVDLLVDGVVTAMSQSSPAGFSIVAPAITGDSQTLTVQARVTDVNGFTTVTSPLVFDVIALAVTGSSPVDGQGGTNLQSITVGFSGNLDPASVNLSGLTLLDLGPDLQVGGGDDTIVPLGSAQVSAGQSLVVQAEQPLASGRYQLTIDPTAVADTNGDHLAASYWITFDNFVVNQSTDVWISTTDGDWGDPGNWSTGAVPQPTDDVFINPLSGSLTVTHSSGDSTVHSLNSTQALVLSGGSLTVTAPSDIQGALTVGPGASLTVQGAGTSFTAAGATTIDGASLNLVDGGTIDLPAGTTLKSGALTIDNSAPGLTALTDLTGTNVTLRNGGNVTFSAGMALKNGSLTIDNTAADLSSLGDLSGTLVTLQNGGTADLRNVTKIDDAGFSIDAGITLALPGVTSYTGGTNNRTIVVTGASSVLDLSGVTTFTGQAGSASQLQVQALDGGLVKLGGVSSLTSGHVSFDADGTGSVIDLSSLTSFDSTDATSLIESTSGGSILSAALLQLNRVDLDLGSLMTTSQITSYTNGQVTVDGVAVDLSGLTSFSGDGLIVKGGGTADLHNAAMIDNSSFDISGGVTFALPAASSYSASSDGNLVLRADGAGTVLDMSALTSLAGQMGTGGLDVQAVNGGVIRLNQVETIPGGRAAVLADGAGSIVDLSALTSFTSSGGQSSLQASHGGSILTGQVARLDGVDLDVAGTIPTATLTSFTNGSVLVDGQAVDLTGLVSFSGDSLTLRNGGTANLNNATSIDNASFDISGGVTFTVPAASSYSAASSRDLILRGSGMGSVLDLSSLTSFAGQTGSGRLDIQAESGGLVNLGRINPITSGHADVVADGPTSVVDLSALTTFTGTDGQSSLTTTGDGSILTGLLGKLDAVDLDLGGPMKTAQLVSYTRGSITADGQAVDLSGLTSFAGDSLTLINGGTADLHNAANIDNASFDVSGGVTLALPAATSYSANNTLSLTLTADGAGSVLDLSSLTTFTGQTGFSPMNIQALNGGLIELSHVSSDITGVAQFLSDGTGSTIDISALTSFSASNDVGGQSSLQASNGGTILMDQLTQLGFVDLYVGGTMATSQITTIVFGSITVDGVAADFSSLTGSNNSGALAGDSFTVTNGGSVFLPNITELEFSSLTATNGGILSLPSVTSFGYASPNLTVLGGGTLALPGLTSLAQYIYLDAEGFGSYLNLSSVSSWSGGSIQAADGAEVNLNGVPSLPAGTSVYAVPSFSDFFGPGGFVDLGSVTEVDGSYLEAAAGGVISLNPGTVSLAYSTINLDADLSFPGSVAAGLLSIDSTSAIQGPGNIFYGNVVNEGQASFVDLYGGGTLSIGGDYQQTASATLTVQVGGDAVSGLFFDQVSSSSAELDGTLNVGLYEFNSGYIPKVGDSFTILTAGSVSGTFATINFPTLAGGLIFEATYNPTSVTLTVVQGGSALMVSAGAAPRPGHQDALTVPQLQPLVTEAIDRWLVSGVTVSQADALEHVQVRIADLPPGYLGLESGNVIWVDQNAAGYGWFVDATPSKDEEFATIVGGTTELASGNSPAVGKVDLLSVLLHEMGHVIGLEHGDLLGVMGESLGLGIRRVPWPGEAAQSSVTGITHSRATIQGQRAGTASDITSATGVDPKQQPIVARSSHHEITSATTLSRPVDVRAQQMDLLLGQDEWWDMLPDGAFGRSRRLRVLVSKNAMTDGHPVT